jgi:alpha-tubulin suppressor-like RCC1 family protein
MKVSRPLLLSLCVLALACHSGSTQGITDASATPDSPAADLAGGAELGVDLGPDGSPDLAPAQDAMGMDVPTVVDTMAFDVSGADAMDAAVDRAVDLGVDRTSVDLAPATACDGGSCSSVLKVVAGGASTCVLMTGNRVKCWGANVYGLLGIGDEVNRGERPNQMGASLPTIDLGSGRTVVDLAIGGSFACALLDGGQVKCWGGNTFGQLGLGDTSPRGALPNQMGDKLPVVNLGQGRVVTSLAAGTYHSCAIFDDGKVKCWGDNLDNKLGVAGTSRPYALGRSPSEMGDALPYVDLGQGRTALAVAAGVGHSCALLDTHQIKCWGSNLWGGLGTAGGSTGLVDLGTGRSALAVSAGHGHTCAILDGGQVKCWGRNEFGQLGQGDMVDRGAKAETMGDALPTIDLGAGRTARQVIAMGSTSCAVLDDQSIKCWGLNDSGQLAVGSTTRYGSQPGQMADSLPAADLGANGRLRVFTGETGHACALFDSGRLVCWGSNGQGQLGLGDTQNRGDSPEELGPAMPSIDVGP